MTHSCRRLRRVALLLPFVAGCAGATLGQSDEPTVELVIHNELPSTITAYLQWEGAATTTRLGVIGPNSSEIYLPPFRGSAICVLTTRFGDTSFSSTVPDRPDGPCRSGTPIDRGERLDMFLRPDRLCFLQKYPQC